MKTFTYLIGASCLLASLLPAGAKVVDLTTAGTSGTANGGLFTQINPNSTGTGVIEPFLRVQANTTEQGFNTSLNQPMPDVKTGTWTHDILLSAIPKVTINGVQYYQFLLDINQNTGGNNNFLSLHELEIWTKSGGPLTSADEYSDLAGGGATKVWDLDAGPDGDSTIELNYDLNPGSGWGDMFAYIPVSALGTDGTKNLYLFSAFGAPKTSNDGFEEWAVLKPAGTPPPVPDAASSIALLGMALVGLGTVRSKFRI
jgi:hypothetical protein